MSALGSEAEGGPAPSTGPSITVGRRLSLTLVCALPTEGPMSSFGQQAGFRSRPKADHDAVHTKAYYNALTEALSSATTRAEAEATLQGIAKALQAGKWP